MTKCTGVALTPEDIERFGENPAASFAANLERVKQRIAAAAHRGGRDARDIRLLPVTKTVPARVLRFAYAAGITEFGENKLQEARGKSEELADLDIRWSIIGHLQTNKVKYLVRFAREFHALDSLRLAGELNRRLEAAARDLDVFVQVNTSAEDSKYGLHPDELLPFLERLHDFPRLKQRGLMTLAIFTDDTQRVRTCFRMLRDLRDRAVAVHPGLTRLSMGMSGDFEVAIEEGADIVRVGQSIFGPRPTGDAAYWPDLFPDTAKGPAQP